eukprot:7788348-Alexandrium_andersonii.AAC.1
MLTPLGTARQCRLALLAVAPAQELLREGAAGVLRTAPVADCRPLVARGPHARALRSPRTGP